MTADHPRSRAPRERGHGGAWEWGLVNDVSKGCLGPLCFMFVLAPLHIFS
jgi:hypothetical protein